MSIELKPSRTYPGRTALHHRTHPESNMATILDLTTEDLDTLRQALLGKQAAAKLIALTLAELGNRKTPTITEWGQAKVLADLFEQRGHITTEDETVCTVCGHEYDGICNADPAHPGYSYCGRK